MVGFPVRKSELINFIRLRRTSQLNCSLDWQNSIASNNERITSENVWIELAERTLTRISRTAWKTNNVAFQVDFTVVTKTCLHLCNFCIFFYCDCLWFFQPISHCKELQTLENRWIKSKVLVTVLPILSATSTFHLETIQFDVVCIYLFLWNSKEIKKSKRKRKKTKHFTITSAVFIVILIGLLFSSNQLSFSYQFQNLIIPTFIYVNFS